MFHIFYSTYADALMYQGSSCRGFTLLLQFLKSENSLFARARTCPNFYFYSDDFWLKLDVCETGRQFPIISVADIGLEDMCFLAGLHFPFILSFVKVCIYGDIKK